MNETIKWIDVNDSLPDADIEVLVCSTNENFPVWIGYHDSEAWNWVSGFRVLIGEVTHWAEMPTGPEVKSNG